MIFLAHSGHNEASPVSGNTTTNNPSASKHQALTAAYSDQGRIYAFKTLFCSQSVQWEHFLSSVPFLPTLQLFSA